MSCQIVSTGDINREKALEILKQPAVDLKIIKEDKEYVIKKLGITKNEFDEIIKLPIKSIHNYPNNHFIEKGFRKLLNKLRSLNFMPN